jgi:L,D-transpeptidase catalytic domain
MTRTWVDCSITGERVWHLSSPTGFKCSAVPRQEIVHPIALVEGPEPLAIEMTVEYKLSLNLIWTSFIMIENLNQDKDISVATLQVKITFLKNGEGTLDYGGTKVKCLGKPGLQYPADSTIYNIEGIQNEGDYKNAYKFKLWISGEFIDPIDKQPYRMHWAVKLIGQLGIFFHQGPDSLVDNGNVPSQGCVHLAAPNARNFYDWITDKTRIQIAYPWNFETAQAE